MTRASHRADVVIIGAGLHGCSAAVHLGLRGLRCIVVEKNTAGRHASGVNAGGVRLMSRHIAEIPLSRASMGLWHRIQSLVGDSCGFQHTGYVRLAENANDLEKLETRADFLRSHGYTHEVMIDREEARRQVPAVADHIVGALACQPDGFASPYRTTMAFQRRAAEQGAVFLEETRALGAVRVGERWRVETTAGTVDAGTLVNCAGAWADRVAEWLGDPVPLRPGGLMLFVTARVPPFNVPVVGLGSRALSFKQSEEGTVVIGGTLHTHADRDTETTSIDFRRIRTSAQTVSEVFPHLRGVPVARAWAGIEGFMPDNLPVIGPSAASPHGIHAFGFSAHGFQLGPISGQIVADLVTQGHSPLPIEPFRVDRFGEDAQ